MSALNLSMNHGEPGLQSRARIRPSWLDISITPTRKLENPKQEVQARKCQSRRGEGLSTQVRLFGFFVPSGTTLGPGCSSSMEQRKLHCARKVGFQTAHQPISRSADRLIGCSADARFLCPKATHAGKLGPAGDASHLHGFAEGVGSVALKPLSSFRNSYRLRPKARLVTCMRLRPHVSLHCERLSLKP